jgi:16S rRNA (guanine1516-N2)-methyltransferase
MPSSEASLAVAFSSPSFEPAAKTLAAELALPLLGMVEPRHVEGYAILLWFDETGLALQLTGRSAPGPVRAEFVTGKAGYRREHGGGSGQLIAKAVGLKRSSVVLHILDATAGLGQDAYVLAGLGCHVTLLERSPIIHALLADGLLRARANAEARPLVDRMTLVAAQGSDWLVGQSSPVADVIYLDPMFPHRGKAAKVKKEMAVFRSVVGADADAESLLAAALHSAPCRVVVKRPRRAPVIGEWTPTLKLEGKSSRYDIYVLRGLP